MVERSDLLCKKITRAFFEIIRRTQWIDTAYESYMTAASCKLEVDAAVTSCDFTDFDKNLRGKEWIVNRAQQQRVDTDAVDEPQRAGLAVVVDCACEPMYWRGEYVVEVEKRHSPRQCFCWNDVRVLLEPDLRFLPK